MAKEIILFKTDIEKDNTLSDIRLKNTPQYLMDVYKLVVEYLLKEDEIQHVLRSNTQMPLCAFVLNIDEELVLPEQYTFEDIFLTNKSFFVNKEIKGNFMLNIDLKKKVLSKDLLNLLYIFNIAINKEINELLG